MKRQVKKHRGGGKSRIPMLFAALKDEKESKKASVRE
jgi:hypothetical protein